MNVTYTYTNTHTHTQQTHAYIYIYIYTARVCVCVCVCVCARAQANSITKVVSCTLLTSEERIYNTLQLYLLQIQYNSFKICFSHLLWQNNHIPVEEKERSFTYTNKMVLFHSLTYSLTQFGVIPNSRIFYTVIDKQGNKAPHFTESCFIHLLVLFYLSILCIKFWL